MRRRRQETRAPESGYGAGKSSRHDIRVRQRRELARRVPWGVQVDVPEGVLSPRVMYHSIQRLQVAAAFPLLSAEERGEFRIQKLKPSRGTSQRRRRRKLPVKPLLGRRQVKQECRGAGSLEAMEKVSSG